MAISAEAENIACETVVHGDVKYIGLYSVTDDLSSVESKESGCCDCKMWVCFSEHCPDIGSRVQAP